MRPEAQLSDPINWDTSVYDKIFCEDIRHSYAISPELWILGRKLSPDPSVMEAPETIYPERVLLQILLHLI